MQLKVKGKPRFRPRRPRIAALLPTVAYMPDDREIQVHIRNISPDGFMAETCENLIEGSRFGIEMPGRGIVRAEVRWAEGHAFGARFEQALDLQPVETPARAGRRRPARAPDDPENTES